jgi:hypothetical protein
LADDLLREFFEVRNERQTSRFGFIIFWGSLGDLRRGAGLRWRRLADFAVDSLCLHDCAWHEFILSGWRIRQRHGNRAGLLHLERHGWRIMVDDQQWKLR